MWLMVMGLGLFAPSPLLRAQQAPDLPGQTTPVAPAPLQPSPPVQPMPDDNQPQPAAAGDQAQQPAAPVDPKTSLPLSPEEIRQREIDKFDPMKRNVDPASPGSNPVTDRQPPAGDAAASDDESSASAQSARKTSQDGVGVGFSGGSDTDLSDTAFAGPAVLSRSYTLSRPMIPQQIKWRFSLGLNYSWDDGETPGAVNATTALVPSTSSSGSVNWALSGSHIWKHDQISLSYGGNYSQYFAQSAGNNSGLNNVLNMEYAHAFSRHVSFHASESLTGLSQNYSIENPALETASVANINLATSPNVQLLNSTVKQSSSSIGLTWRLTSRLSFDATVSEFLIRQTGVAVTGNTGQQFGGDLNYRWTRKTTVGAFYSYTSYLYSQHVSQSDSHSIGLIYSYALGPHTQLRTRFGATRIETLGYETVALSPELAAILGQGSVVVNAYSLNWTSDISAQLVREFRGRRTGSLSFAHGESPGNGVLLTSVQESISAGYSMALLRRIPLNLGAVYSTLNSTGQGSLGFYRSETYYAGVSRPVGHGVSTNFRVDYSRYQISGSPLQGHDLRISVGFGWSPSPDLLRF